MDWNIVSSVSTAAASLVALGAIGVSVVLYVRQHNETRAAQIREDIRGFVDVANNLIRLLLDGSPVIAASWHSASTLRSSLPETATVDQARSLLRAKGVGLSLAVIGWGESTQAGALETAVAGVATASRRLTGDLNVISETGELLRLVTNDLTTTSIRLLQGEALTMLLDASDDEDLPRFIASFATGLHGNAAMYFQYRYRDTVQALSQLLSIVGVALSQLSANDLLVVARASTAVVDDAGTRTGAMRRSLLRMRDRLPNEVVTRAGQLIDDVERTITTDAAREQLDAGQRQPA